jgi:hypothetical protein
MIEENFPGSDYVNVAWRIPFLRHCLLCPNLATDISGPFW